MTSSLKDLLESSAPRPAEPDLDHLWSRGRRARRRHRLAVAALPTITVCAALALAIGAAARDEPQITAGRTTTSTAATPSSSEPSAGERTFPAGDVRTVDLSGGLDVTISQGSGDVRVITDPEVFADLVMVVSETSVSINRRFNPDHVEARVAVELEVSALEEVELTAGVNVTVRGIDQDTDAAIAVTAGARLDAELVAPAIDLDVDGGAHVTFAGSAASLDLAGRGGSRVDLAELEVATAQVDLGDGSSAQVHVTDLLQNVVLSLGSRLDYAGDPDIGATSVDISSSLQQLN